MRIYFPLAILSTVLAASLHAQQPSKDSVRVTAVVDGFHAAIRAGDAAAAMRLVADDAVFLEARVSKLGRNTP